MDAYGELDAPEDGVIVHGLFVDAGRWFQDRMKLVDAKPGMSNCSQCVDNITSSITLLLNDNTNRKFWFKRNTFLNHLEFIYLMHNILNFCNFLRPL